jgi:hypothetical protein
LVIGGLAIILAWGIEGAASLLAGLAVGVEVDLASGHDYFSGNRRCRGRGLATNLEAVPNYGVKTVSLSHWYLGGRTYFYLKESDNGAGDRAYPGDNLDSAGNFFDFDQAAYRGVNVLFDAVPA